VRVVASDYRFLTSGTLPAANFSCYKIDMEIKLIARRSPEND
jgi:hypothetical protein